GETGCSDCPGLRGRFLTDRMEPQPGTKTGASAHRCWPNCGSLYGKDQNAHQPEHKSGTAGDCRPEPKVRSSRSRFSDRSSTPRRDGTCNVGKTRYWSGRGGSPAP